MEGIVLNIVVDTTGGKTDGAFKKFMGIWWKQVNGQLLHSSGSFSMAED